MIGTDDPGQGSPDGPLEDLDRAVLLRVSNGELRALEELYERYSAMAFSLASRITRDPTVAEDVVQDAFLGAWRHADRYLAARGSVRTWLLSIVHHRAVDAVRRRRRADELPDSDAAVPSQLILADLWPEVAGRLDAQAIALALATLSAVQREAIELAYYGGLTQTEIAERTQAPLGTVKSRMRLGLLAMRRALGGDGRDGQDAGAFAEAGAEP